jgi:APA family basic amino acid/polyamine antiporter
MALKREIGLFGAVAYGVGIILGAGIYALIGKASGMAGNAVWLSFLLAAVVAVFTGFSYAELSSAFPKSSGEFVYAREAFGKAKIAFLVGWLVIFSSVTAMSTVALSFAGYLSFWFGTPIIPAAVGLVLTFSAVNFIGIRESVRTNIILTTVEASGLVMIILIGINWYGKSNYLEMRNGLPGVFSAAALIFFAYMGFESIVKIAEEMKNPQKNLPKTILTSVLITSGIYLAVAFSAISILSPLELEKSIAPLADIASRVLGDAGGVLLAVIALIATANTVLISNITVSRMFYGMAVERALPGTLGRIHKTRGSPWVAIALSALISVLFILLGDLKIVAEMADFAIFAVFIVVNLSLIQLRRKKLGFGASYRVPFNLKNFPTTALIGIVTCVFLALQFEWFISLIGTLVMAIGIAVHMLYEKVAFIKKP